MIQTCIHRTEIAITDRAELQLRGYIRSLHVAPHRKSPERHLEIWYEMADIDEVMTVRFHVHGTGHPFSHRWSNTPYVGSVLVYQGELMFHVYAEYPLDEKIAGGAS